MDYDKLIERLQRRARTKKPFIAQGEIWTGGMVKDELCADAATAITDLPDRAEAAEARAEKAERERDAAVTLCGKLTALCSPPKEWEPKLFRRHINRPGDYMGCGYDFLDSFNRIFDNFVETADEELYAAIREAAEKEILERTRRMIGQKEE